MVKPISNGFKGDIPQIGYTISDNHGGTASSTLDISLGKSSNQPNNNNDTNTNGQVLAKVSIDGAKTIDEGAKNAEYTLQLDTISTKDVTVTVEILAGRASPVVGHGSPTNGEDFTADSQTVTIPKGETTATIRVPILDDTKVESPEDYTIYIKEVKNGKIADDYLIVTTINDNDSKPVVGEARDISPITDYQIDDIGEIELDFSKLADIDKIDMDNGTNQNINLSANDVLNITDTNNQLFVDGDNTDTVNLTGFNKQTNSDKVDYDLYLADNNIALYLDTDIGIII